MAAPGGSQEEEKEVVIHKKKRKKPALSRFVDDEAGESRLEKQAKKKRETRAKTKELKEKIKAREELEKLLGLYKSVEDYDIIYIYWKRADWLTLVQAMKWAYQDEPEEHDRLANWQTAPIENPLCSYWDDNNHDDGERSYARACDLGAYIDKTPEEQADRRAQARSYYHQICMEDIKLQDGSRVSFDGFRRLAIAHGRARQIYLNPDARDKTIADIVYLKIADNFHFTSVDGTSIAWDPETCLWIPRTKEQAHYIVASSIEPLLGSSIQFTNAKTEKKFLDKVYNVSISSVISMLKGRQRFPNPIADKVDASPWCIPIMDKKCIELKTLTVRDRHKDDFFTAEMKFQWDEKKLDSLDLFKKKLNAEGALWVGNTKYQPVVEIALAHHFPLAMQLVSQCFHDPERRWSALIRMGIFLTTHELRHGTWIWGKTKGTKSSLFQACVKVMGDFGVIVSKKCFFNEGKWSSSSGHNTDLMRILNKRLVMIDEIGSNDHLLDSIYKNFVSHQKLSMRQIYGGQGEYPVRGNLLILHNPVPRFNVSDDATTERMVVIKATSKLFSPSDTPDRIAPHFRIDEEWKDSYDPSNEHFWIRASAEGKKFVDSFQVDEAHGGHAHELGCLMAVMAYIAGFILDSPDYDRKIVDPPLVVADTQDFFYHCDFVRQFVAELYDIIPFDERSDNGCSLEGLWKDFKEWKDYNGLPPRVVTRADFVKNLQSQNLIWQDKSHPAKLVYVRSRNRPEYPQ